MTVARGVGGRLHVVATPIGNLGDLSRRASEILVTADLIACEDTRRTGRLLEAIGPRRGRFVRLDDHTEAGVTDRLVGEIAGGAQVALVSDAGTPGIADPGATLIAAVIETGLPVEVVPGPSAVITALIVSGLSTARFCFEGFLPRKGAERARRLATVAVEERTTVLFESPNRVGATLGDLAEVCGSDRRVAVCRELTKLHEEVWRGGLGAAAEQFGRVAPRGEVVVVLEGWAGPPPADDGDILAALHAARAAGCSTRDAVERVTAQLGVGRSRVYPLALEPNDP